MTIRQVLHLVVAAALASGCEAETPEAWGGIHVTAFAAEPGGIGGAWIEPGSPPENLPRPGECKLFLGTPSRTTVGDITLRIGGGIEQVLPRNARGDYTDFSFTEAITPGMRISAESEGNATYPGFLVETMFPPFVAGAVIPGEEGAVLSRDEPMLVTWNPAGGDYEVGFSVDHPESGTTVGCAAKDSDGAITVPSELLQVHYPGVDIHLRLVRTPIARVDAEGLDQVRLYANHVVGHNVTFSP